MPRPTSIIQPVIYEMLVLTQSLIDLREYVGFGRQHPAFPKRESALGSALIRIRSLAEFWGGTDPTGKGRPKGKDIITVESLHPPWPPDNSFYSACWQPISEYVDHLIDKRYTKTTKRPTAHFAQRHGRRILSRTRCEMDRRIERGEIKLVGDARRWYEQFKRLFRQYLEGR